jgi:integrator complex subunit 6
MLRDTFQKMHAEISTFENYNIVVPTVMNIQSTKNYRNPFDIPRRDLIDEISRMRDNFFKLPTCNINLLSKDAGHSLPIAEMGNYQDYLKRREAPLRELEPTNVRQHMFGNPYKRDKHMVMVDEADDITADPSSPNNKVPNANKKDIRMSRKRKAGPIRKDFVYKRARMEFGFPPSPGLPSAPSIISTDSEDSDVSSEASFSFEGDDDVRSTSDFSEISNDDDFRMNGHMPDYNFDSVMNDSGVESPNVASPVPHYPPLRQPPGILSLKSSTGRLLDAKQIFSSILAARLSTLNLQQLDSQQPPSMHFQQNYPSHHFHQPPIGSVPVLPHPSPNNGDISGNSLQNPAIGSAMAQPVPTSPTGPPPPFPSSSTTTANTPAPTPIPIRPSHNDLNDVQNISKILSSIHNGSGSSISTNHNNNHSNDKRLFVDEPLSKANHKDEGPKAGDEKQHHRSKRKPKAATVVTSPAPPTVVVINAKQNQHKHTNGLNNSTEKQVNNCHSLLNGDDSYGVEQVAKCKQENKETRSSVFKEVRRLGRDYSGLYKQLEKVKGTSEMRFEFMQMCIDEANRFRRKHMASCIKEWWEKQSDEKGPELKLKE